MQATDEALVANGQAASEPKRRRRTGKKRLSFEVPQQMPAGVRELWRASPTAAQQQAHQACVEILAMWLGRKQREEVARTLSIPPLRVWQLSQQALSGMLAGLLKQPRTRRRQGATMVSSEEDPRALKKRIAALEQENQRQGELIRLLAQLPKLEHGPPESTPSKPAAKRATRKAAASREAGGDKPPGESPGGAR